MQTQEVIELTLVIVDVKKQQIKSEFQTYVKPVKDPELSVFCTELTGIT